MFEPPYGETPFLGPSQRLTPTIPTRATFQHPVARGTVRNENLNRPYQDNEPATPQPVANAGSVPALRSAMMVNDDATSVAAVRGSKMNVAPPGEEKLVRELKKDPGVDNPFALAWWIHGRK